MQQSMDQIVLEKGDTITGLNSTVNNLREEKEAVMKQLMVAGEKVIEVQRKADEERKALQQSYQADIKKSSEEMKEINAKLTEVLGAARCVCP